MKNKVDPRIPKHTSGLGIIISIVAVFMLISGVLLIAVGFSLPLLGVGTIPFGLSLIILSFILFGIAELVYNSGFQNKLLTELLKLQLPENPQHNIINKKENEKTN